MYPQRNRTKRVVEGAATLSQIAEHISDIEEPEDQMTSSEFMPNSQSSQDSSDDLPLKERAQRLSKREAAENDWELNTQEDVGEVESPPSQKESSKNLAVSMVSPLGVNSQGLKSLLVTIKEHELKGHTGYCIDISTIIDIIGKRKGHIKTKLDKIAVGEYDVTPISRKNIHGGHNNQKIMITTKGVRAYMNGLRCDLGREWIRVCQECTTDQMLTTKERAKKIIEPFGIDHDGLKELLVILRTCELQKDTGYCIDIKDIVICLGKIKGNIKRDLAKLGDFFCERY